MKTKFIIFLVILFTTALSIAVFISTNPRVEKKMTNDKVNNINNLQNNPADNSDGDNIVSDQEKQQKITFAIDKTIYNYDEKIKINIKNNSFSDSELSPIAIEGYKENKWVVLKYTITCPCYAKCEAVSFTIPTGNTFDESWKPKTYFECLQDELKFIKKFRFKITEKNIGDIYSNEFFIKTKIEE